MLQVARLAPKQLHEASDAVLAFVNESFAEDGGGRDRAGESDLYYTVFSLECLQALQAAPPEQTRAYLTGFGSGEKLDLIHLSCLARAWAALPDAELPAAVRRELAERIAAHRSDDGGFAAAPGARQGTAYHSFMAMGAYQDLGIPCPATESWVESLLALRTREGSYANSHEIPVGSAPTTAAVVCLLRQLDAPIPAGIREYLLGQFHPEGGFMAVSGAPLPDLLSTATVLHALVSLGEDVAPFREPCLDFVDTLWTGRAFCAHWAEDVVDTEYCFYGLLALGHLSL